MAFRPTAGHEPLDFERERIGDGPGRAERGASVDGWASAALDCLGDVLWVLARFEEAIAAYEQALELDPDVEDVRRDARADH